MNEFIESVQASLGPTLFNIIVFVLILVVGYVVAKIVESLTRKGLRKTTLDNRVAAALSDRPAAEIPTERYLSKGLFWLVMIFVFIAAFDALNLAAVSEPLSQLVSDILAFLPRLLGAAVLAVIAFVVASLLRMLTTKTLDAANVDERIRTAGTDERTLPAHDPARQDVPTEPVQRDPSLAKTLGDAVYYFVLLLFLPAILGTLGLEGILAPVQELVNEVIGFLPNLLLAAVIVVVGTFVAKILRNIVANLLAAAGTDRLSERVGLARATGSHRLSDLVGLVVYVLVLIPVIVAALNALAVEAVTRPASAMLNEFLAAIPRVFVAVLILAVAWVVGRLLASLVANVLEGVGFNRLFESLGFSRAHDASPATTGDAAEETSLDTRTPSGIVGVVVLVGVMLFAGAEAASALDLEVLAVLIAEFTVLAGRVLLGLLIFAIGLYLANLAYSAVKSSGTSQATVLAVASRVAILVLAGAMALKQMGLADSIINLAFGLTLGAIAVAAAIAFGIGGRELAREQLEKLRDRAENERLEAPGALKPDPREPGTEASQRDPRPGAV